MDSNSSSSQPNQPANQCASHPPGTTYMAVEQIGDATLYLGSCLDVMPALSRVDAVVTDPPYGIDFKYESHDDNEPAWFDLINRALPLCRALADFVIMPSCKIQRLDWWYATHKPEWIVAWHKGSPGHASKVGFNDWEPHVCWGRPKRPMHDHFSTQCGFDANGHPCPKPVAYANWLVSRAAATGETILDPFMGSGTTGVACANLGRKFIGIEKEPKYFDIACERIAAAYSQGRLFA
jgi:site-specific DNA-methyltransferase (adenine-specific)